MVVLALLALLVFAVVALFLGPAWLLWSLPGGLPLGTLLAAAGLVAGAAVPVLVMPGGRGFRILALLVLAAAVLWFPLGLLLAGNPGLNFDGGAASQVFWTFTKVTVSAMLVMLLATGLKTASSAGAPALLTRGVLNPPDRAPVKTACRCARSSDPSALAPGQRATQQTTTDADIEHLRQ